MSARHRPTNLKGAKPKGHLLFSIDVENVQIKIKKRKKVTKIKKKYMFTARIAKMEFLSYLMTHFAAIVGLGLWLMLVITMLAITNLHHINSIICMLVL